jgi:hypothetical protein
MIFLFFFLFFLLHFSLPLALAPVASHLTLCVFLLAATLLRFGRGNGAGAR